ncbi:carbohydrate kinase family protein [Curvibacter sp. CHRR-16]|uniref:carbohydrate kinase family protein n=1 Tax=Curvibacter sp. CHRR-16 TaxID=2835872 RepID=UPI001BD9E299|nr:carbohydrate kinase family protein [Curvibacter sp. CHRR-16]MBT0571028.1 carbohydrate kinase family protein [Curvibacter sp. CHRR-16]
MLATSLASTPGSNAVATPVVLVVGGINLDISAFAAVPLRAGDSVPGQVRYAPGGVGRNVAENLVRLGAAVALVSAVGQDAWGQQLLSHARELGIDVQGIQTPQGQRTATYVCTLDEHGEVLAAVNDMAVLDSLDTEGVLQRLRDVPAHAAVVLDCNLQAQLLHRLVRQCGGTVRCMVDGVSVHKCQRVLPVLEQVHTLKLNGMEAQALTGASVQTVEQAQEAVRALLARGVQRVVITLGAVGVVWGTAEQVVLEPAQPVQVLSATGAGDALLAGLVFADGCGWSTREAVRYGMACAAITLECAQANDPHLNHAQVLQRMAVNH